MITYKKIPYKSKEGVEGTRYLKNNKLTKESRIPHEVTEKFEFVDTVNYDDEPDRRRCTACDAPQSRVRYLNGEQIDLCEFHYQTMSLGKIAAQVRLLKQEQEKQLEENPPDKRKVRSSRRRITQLSKSI